MACWSRPVYRIILSVFRPDQPRPAIPTATITASASLSMFGAGMNGGTKDMGISSELDVVRQTWNAEVRKYSTDSDGNGNLAEPDQRIVFAIIEDGMNEIGHIVPS